MKQQWFDFGFLQERFDLVGKKRRWPHANNADGMSRGERKYRERLRKYQSKPK